MRRRAFLAGSLGIWTHVSAGAQAQQTGKIYRVGVLNPVGNAGLSTPQWEAFSQSLNNGGFAEGRNLAFDHRFAKHLRDLPTMAADLAKAHVDVIVVRGPAPMQAAKAATSAIPIVMAMSSSDPVGEGLIASYARPGGNITGVTYAVSGDRFAKQLDLLKEAVGPISRVAILWDIDIEHYRRNWSDTLPRAAEQLGLRILGPYQVTHDDEFGGAFATMADAGAEAVLMSAGAVALTSRTRIGELGIRHRLPIMAAFNIYPRAGALMSYGPDPVAAYERVAAYVAKILKGAKPADLPVENPTTYELVINLKTAKALGLEIPPSILARADEVIE